LVVWIRCVERAVGARANVNLSDLTNAQFSILNAHPNPRMTIEHWELSIGQIPDFIRYR